MMRAFYVSAWNNGNPNNFTGAGYGIRIPIKIRNTVFKKEWDYVILKLDNKVIKVNISPSFWRGCSELRSKEIGKWLLKHKLAPWKNNPPKIKMIHEAENIFKLQV